LPRLWRPVFEAQGFEGALVDRYFLQARDDARSALLAAGARSVVAFGLLCCALLSGCDFQRMTVQRKSSPNWTPPDGAVARTTPLDEGPPPFTLECLERGRERFEIFCAACHGVLGDADTVVADRMTLRRPRSLQDAEVREKAPGEIYEVIARGYGLMPSFAAQLPIEDRWAVARYVKALQLSQAASLDDLPAPVRSQVLERIR
jgi:mono/diheme cytochrome c family protein